MGIQEFWPPRNQIVFLRQNRFVELRVAQIILHSVSFKKHDGHFLQLDHKIVDEVFAAFTKVNLLSQLILRAHFI